MINRWTYNTPVPFHEIRLGNRFHLSTLSISIVTDIGEDETLQLLNTWNGDTYVNETVDSIKPIFLSDGGNLLIENHWLGDQGFIYNDEKCRFEKDDICIKQGLAVDHWTIQQGEVIQKVLFQHELQNAYYSLTGKELK